MLDNYQVLKYIAYSVCNKPYLLNGSCQKMLSIWTNCAVFQKKCWHGL